MAWIFSKERFIENNIPALSHGKLRASYGTTGNDQMADYGYYDLWNPNNYNYGSQRAFIPVIFLILI